MLGLVLLPLCAIHVCLAGELIRIEEKLTTDREFYDQWMQLISLQAEQLEEQSLDYPLSVDSLNSCSRVPPGDTEDLSDSLRPSSVSVYADIGHLTAYCKSNFSAASRNTGLMRSSRDDDGAAVVGQNASDIQPWIDRDREQRAR